MANIHDSFELYERRRARVVQPDESNEGHIQFQMRDDFKVNTFPLILDQLYSAMCETYADAKKISDKFRSIVQLGTLQGNEFRG